MDIKIVQATEDWYKIAFKDTSSGQQVMLSISGSLIRQWNLRTDQLIPTATTLAGEVFFNHDPSQPFKEEYQFTPANSGPTVDETVALIRQNSI